MRYVHGLAVAVLIVVAYILAQGGLSTAPPPSPSSARTPPPAIVPTTTPGPSLAVCQTQDLTTTAASWGAAGGTTSVSITMALVGSSPCLLLNGPEVALQDHEGHVLAGTPIVTHLGMTDAFALRTSATLTAVWSSWCGVPPPQPLSVRFELYGGESVTVPLPVGVAAVCRDVASTLYATYTTPDDIPVVPILHTAAPSPRPTHHVPHSGPPLH